jgi:hypothetical protein
MKTTLLKVTDGPEGIEIYTDDDEAIIDWGAGIPGIYIIATASGAYVKIGPFQLKSIREGVERILNVPH